MPHTDTLLHLKQRHDGQPPASWAGGDLDFQKAKVIAALAWHMTKDAEDPELPACDLSHQENLTGIVESIMRGNDPDPTPFARTAHQLWLEATTPPEEDTTNAREEIRS